MKEAMQLVKADLGADAVILHTKKYREGGILGFNAKEVVEVTAAIEDTPEPPKKKTPAKSKPTKPANRIDVVSEPESPVLPPLTTAQRSQGLRTYGTQQQQDTSSANAEAGRQAAQARFDAMVATLAKGADATPNPQIIKADQAAAMMQPASTQLPVPPVPPQVMPAVQQPLTVPQEQNVPLQQQQQPQTQPQPVPPQPVAVTPAASAEPPEPQPSGDQASMNEADAKKIQALQEELAQMKTLLAQVMVKDQPKGVRTLAEALQEQEVSDEIQKDLAATAAAGDTVRDSLTPEAHAALADYLAENIQFSSGLEPRQDNRQPEIVALIGATGVGKTTTLAKIAARFVLEQGIDAALVTADTYRISAVEQLKTYSDIIGLPLEIVYSPQELKTAIHKFRKKDLILIDTAGRSQHNEFQMKELCDFLAVHPRIQRYLVMSATTKNRDASDILEKFAVCEPDHVIFTKTDETASVGLILNLLYEKELSLAFFTNGQSVPDDIVPATPDALADLLLRE